MFVLISLAIAVLIPAFLAWPLRNVARWKKVIVMLAVVICAYVSFVSLIPILIDNSARLVLGMDTIVAGMDRTSAMFLAWGCLPLVAAVGLATAWLVAKPRNTP